MPFLARQCAGTAQCPGADGDRGPRGHSADSSTPADSGNSADEPSRSGCTDWDRYSSFGRARLWTKWNEPTSSSRSVRSATTNAAPPRFLESESAHCIVAWPSDAVSCIRCKFFLCVPRPTPRGISSLAPVFAVHGWLDEDRGAPFKRELTSTGSRENRKLPEFRDAEANVSEEM